MVVCLFFKWKGGRRRRRRRNEGVGGFKIFISRWVRGIGGGGGGGHNIHFFFY